MSRARNLKPGFFKNDLLAECDPLARILFQGLWCEADREGRLEDRPKRLKAECLPYDECNIEALLAQLEARGFIVRYVIDGQAFISIPQFAKHQNPHVKEADSTIPAPNQHSSSTGLSEESPEQAGLIPLSPSPRIDSPIGGKPPKAEKCSALADDWAVPADWIAEAKAKKPGVDWSVEAERFASHHKSKGSRFERWKQAWWTWVNSPYQKAAPPNATLPAGGRRKLGGG